MTAVDDARTKLAEFDEYADAGGPVDWRVGEKMTLLRTVIEHAEALQARIDKALEWCALVEPDKYLPDEFARILKGESE